MSEYWKLAEALARAEDRLLREPACDTCPACGGEGTTLLGRYDGARSELGECVECDGQGEVPLCRVREFWREMAPCACRDRCRC